MLLTVPQEFGYLTEKSVIRACVDFIIEAGRKGNNILFNFVITSSGNRSLPSSIPVNINYILISTFMSGLSK